MGSKKIIIPQGLINPNETTIIEIPRGVGSEATLIARTSPSAANPNSCSNARCSNRQRGTGVSNDKSQRLMTTVTSTTVFRTNEDGDEQVMRNSTEEYTEYMTSPVDESGEENVQDNNIVPGEYDSHIANPCSAQNGHVCNDGACPVAVGSRRAYNPGSRNQDFRTLPNSSNINQDALAGFRTVPNSSNIDQDATSGFRTLPYNPGGTQDATSGFRTVPLNPGGTQDATSAYRTVPLCPGGTQDATSGFRTFPSSPCGTQDATSGFRMLPNSSSRFQESPLSGFSALQNDTSVFNPPLSSSRIIQGSQPRQRVQISPGASARGFTPPANSTPRGGCQQNVAAPAVCNVCRGRGFDSQNLREQVERHLAEIEESERQRINKDLAIFQQARRRLVENATNISSGESAVPFNNTNNRN